MKTILMLLLLQSAAAFAASTDCSYVIADKGANYSPYYENGLLNYNNSTYSCVSSVGPDLQTYYSYCTELGAQQSSLIVSLDGAEGNFSVFPKPGALPSPNDNTVLCEGVGTAPQISKATAKEIAGLQKAILASSKSTKTVKCKNVITVPTTGTMNSSTAGVCTLDGSEYELVCQNNMVGSLAVSVRLQPNWTEQDELLTLIYTSCTGS